ncbi:hypothetical protein JXA70_15680 [candidate division KSB1 bacterium]|nr:hypothetical protein [candidate division KSB1 bacterium]
MRPTSFSITATASAEIKILDNDDKISWDFHATYFTFVDAKTQFGLEIENIKTDHFYKVQEWFIPWGEIELGEMLK